jgi:hypothetical protein
MKQYNNLPASVQQIGSFKCNAYRNIPDGWLDNITTTSRGVTITDYPACLLLSYIVSWYKPKVILNDDNVVVGYAERFSGDAPIIENAVACKALRMQEHTVRAAFAKLESLMLIKCELRTVGTNSNNRRLVFINAGLINNISEISYNTPPPSLHDVKDPTNDTLPPSLHHVGYINTSLNTNTNSINSQIASDLRGANSENEESETDNTDIQNKEQDGTQYKRKITENVKTKKKKVQNDETSKDLQREGEAYGDSYAPPPPAAEKPKTPKWDMKAAAAAVDTMHEKKVLATPKAQLNPIDWGVKNQMKFGQLKKILECLNIRYKAKQKKSGTENPVDMTSDVAVERISIYTAAAYDYYAEIQKQLNSSLVIFGLDFMLSKFDKVIAFHDNKSNQKAPAAQTPPPVAKKYNFN